MPDTFTGFPKSALTFFRQLSKNNERDWFTPRKAAYEENCKRPMELLVAGVNERLRKVAVEYVASEPRRAVYRVYRDTRFAKDKTPYKTHVAALFGRAGYARNRGSGFYVQVSPEYVGVGGGVYMPEGEELRAIREAIVREPKRFLKVVEEKGLVKLMGELQGESAKRAPKGFEEVPASIERYVRLKQFFFWTELPAKAALEKSLVKVVSDRLEAMAPACEWLHEALAAAVSRDEEHRVKRPEPMF